MDLHKPTDRRSLVESPRVSPTTNRRAAIVQGARLSIGLGGIAGGALLLATNVVATVTTAATSLPWVSLSANLALILGSAMFLREYARARHVDHGDAS